MEHSLAMLPPRPVLFSRRPTAGDVVAGISVALVTLPQSLAYAELAGLPAQYGLFASALPPLFAALFVSSPYLQTGPTATVALLTFGALSSMAAPYSPSYVGLAALLALMVGALRLILGLVRMGRVAYLLSEPVLLGFTSGAAVLIVSSQVPKAFGASAGGDGVLRDAAAVLTDPGVWDWGAIAFAFGAVVAMAGGRRLHDLFPGVLLAVVLGVVVGMATDYSGAVVGALDNGFVSLNRDFPWASADDLVVPAAAIAVVGFAEPSSIARTFAAKDRQRWNADQEMLSQGAANVAAALSGAFPVGGSFSRSSLNRLAGARTAWSGAVTGMFVLAAMPLVGLLEHLPTAVLGGIVIGAVLKLVNLRGITELAGESRAQAVVALGTLLATLVTAPRVERGVLAGIGLAVAVHLWRELNVTVASRRKDDTLTVAPHGVLWFATVPSVERLIRGELAEHPEVSHVVVDLGAVGRLDYSGAAALARLIEEVSSSGTRVDVVNVGTGAARAARAHLAAWGD